ncbi:MAG: SURF1 family protein [Cellulomonadaceae bacterium]|nr:SURF1 family protein [Cellulomonadaceae bacterium]
MTDRPDYVRTARSPRMLGLLVLLLLAAAVCGRLGVWQLDRATERGAAGARAQEEAAASHGAVPLDEVLPPQTTMSGDLLGRVVQVSGTYGTDELLVPGRVLDGVVGVLVLTPLQVTGTDAVLAVVRGWVPDVAAAQTLDPAPTGTVDLTGYLRAAEAGGEGGLPEGQVDAISPAELVNRWGGPIYSAYVVLETVEPAQDPDLLPLGQPEPGGDALNLQNLAYALQWWIFGGFAVALWVRIVRDEARAEVEEMAAAEQPVTTDR